MNFNINKLLKSAALIAVTIGSFASCNKDVPNAKAILAQALPARSILDTINNDASFTFLKAAIARASTGTATPSLSALLGDRSGVFTVFAPTDAAFMLSGFPSIAAFSAFRPGQLDTLIRYHIVGGQKITGSVIPTTFPNLQLPSLFALQAPSVELPPGFRMPIFPSKRGTSFWVNNIPLTQSDINAGSGVIHKTAAVVLPPSTTLKGLIATNPTKYSILSAAIARADSGQAAGLGRLDSVINYAPANLTLFAPNNDAFRAMFPPGTPDANIIGALNTPAFFTAQTVRGLIAYHLLGSRAFSVNFAAGPTPVNTQLVIPPPVNVVVPVFVTYGGVAFTVRGVAPGSTDATVLTRDVHAVNGVLHEINQVLRPQ